MTDLIKRLEEFLSGATTDENFRITKSDLAATPATQLPELQAMLDGLDTDQFYSQPPTNDDSITITKINRGSKEPGFAQILGSAGPGDVGERQLEEGESVPSDNPFRPRYRKLGLPTASHHDDIKNQAMVLLGLFRQIPRARAVEGLESSGEEHANTKLAQRHLEDAVYRAVKALTA